MAPQHYQKKSLGQHFLHDQNVINQLITLIAPQPSDHLVEIGPGAGALTTKLLLEVDALDVIEIDATLIPILQSNCNYSAKLHIYCIDVLKFDWSQFHPPLRLVGNLPYNISTPLLFRLIKNIQLIKDMHFMLQKEVAERMVAAPGTKTYGRLSVMLQYYCQPQLLLHLGAEIFSPPPKVDSAFIRLLPRARALMAHNENNLSEVVRLAFNQRRKTIVNSLKTCITKTQLETLGINPRLRPEQLTVDEFVQISNTLVKSLKT